MKRKDFDGEFSPVYMSLPSTKSRRLDAADIFPIRNEDPRTIAPQIVDHGLPQEPHSTTTSGCSMVVHKDLFPIEIYPSDEKALVVYNPPLFRSPVSSGFSIILNSNLNPGLKSSLKDIFLLGKSKSVKQDVYEVSKKGETNSCLAIVPWGQYHLPVASKGEAEEMSDPMEAEEEAEMMNMDGCNFGCSGGTAFGLDAMDEGAARML